MLQIPALLPEVVAVYLVHQVLPVQRVAGRVCLEQLQMLLVAVLPQLHLAVLSIPLQIQHVRYSLREHCQLFMLYQRHLAKQGCWDRQRALVRRRVCLQG